MLATSPSHRSLGHELGHSALSPLSSPRQPAGRYVPPRVRCVAESAPQAPERVAAAGTCTGTYRGRPLARGGSAPIPQLQQHHDRRGCPLQVVCLGAAQQGLDALAGLPLDDGWSVCPTPILRPMAASSLSASASQAGPTSPRARSTNSRCAWCATTVSKMTARCG